MISFFSIVFSFLFVDSLYLSFVCCCDVSQDTDAYPRARQVVGWSRHVMLNEPVAGFFSH